MRFPILFSLVVTCSFLAGAPTYANVSLPAIFGDHMVLQRERENKVWGSAEPSEKITVKIADQQHTATADEAGRMAGDVVSVACRWTA